MPVDALARRVGLAFQNPDNQFFKFSVDAELRVGPEVLGILDNRWIEELMAITISLEDVLARITSSRDVIQGSFVLDAQWSDHNKRSLADA